MNWKDRYDLVIGLEVHVQLDLLTKAFAPESNELELNPNTLISPVSIALPGTLPVLNQEYLEAAVLLGLAFDSNINNVCYFDRKHYFYADLPKGYQITQDAAPFCTGGQITTFVNGGPRHVRLHHIHMEEDAGKSIHDLSPNNTFLDFNRAGTPLLEIVTEPDLNSEEEVSACISAVQQIVQYLGISSADMEKGMLRCDCNVSLKPKGSAKLGLRCEIKNLNSKKYARKAIKSEVKRQVQILDAGESVEPMTMSYEVASDRNVPIRDKETIHDYRYFPEPDLPVFSISNQLIKRCRSGMPTLPKSYFEKFTGNYGIEPKSALVMISSLKEAVFVDDFLRWFENVDLLSNMYLQRIRGWMIENNWSTGQIHKRKDQIIEYCQLIQSGKVPSSRGLQELLPVILNTSDVNVKSMAESLGLISHTDTSMMETDITAILSEFPEKVSAYQNGKKGLIGFFMGELMRRSKQKPDPKVARAKFETILSDFSN